MRDRIVDGALASSGDDRREPRGPEGERESESDAGGEQRSQELRAATPRPF